MTITESSKLAAKAVLNNDPSIGYKVCVIRRMDHNHPDRHVAVMRLLRDIMCTWPLALAAQAANTSEQSVIVALVCHGPLRIGTAVVARGIVAELYDAVAKEQIRQQTQDRLEHLETFLEDVETDDDTLADVLKEIAELKGQLALA